MKVNIEFECGEKTCEAEPGNLCRFLGTQTVDHYFKCMLFDAKLSERDGFQRCEQCLKEVKAIK